MSNELSTNIGNDTVLDKDNVRPNTIKQALWSMRVNYIFYIGTCICIWWLSYVSCKSMFQLIYTIIILSFMGYITHMISHIDYVVDLMDRMLEKIKKWGGLMTKSHKKYPQIMIDSCGEGGYGGRGIRYNSPNLSTRSFSTIH